MERKSSIPYDKPGASTQSETIRKKDDKCNRETDVRAQP